MRRKLFTLILALTAAVPAFAQHSRLQQSGAITGSQCFTMPVTDYGTVTFTVTNQGTAWSGTIQPEGSIGQLGASNLVVIPSNSQTAQSTVTANGSYIAIVAGFDSFQLCGNTVTNTANITANAVSLVAISSSGGGGASGTVTAIQASGANLHVNVDNNQTAASGALSNASSPSCTGAGVGGNGITVATGGAGTVAINVTGTNTSAIGFYYSIDGSNYQAVPSNVVFPVGGGASVTTFSVNGQWTANVAGYSDFMVCGPAGAAQTATINLQASLGFSMPGLSSLMPGTVAGTAPNATSITGCIFNSAGVTPTTGQTLPCQMNSTGGILVSSAPSQTALVALTPSSQAALTTAVAAKASPGALYGFQVTNGAASICYLEFMNSTAPTLGTAAVYSFQVPASSTLTAMPGSYSLSQFSLGVSVGMATTYNGSTACGTAASAVIFYK